MSSIEITDNTIVRSLIRKGDDTSRLRITLLSGELGYTTDTKRLFVGDGVTPGGVISGNKYLGSASEGGGVASLNVQPGDLVVNNGNLYARNVDGSGNPVQFDGDDAGFTKIGNTANIDGNGLKIDADNNLNVLVDNATIEIDSASEELKVKEVPLNKLEEGAANSIVANGNTTTSTPSYIPVNDSSVLGRLDSLAGLTSISFNDVIFNANSPTLNGTVTVKSLAGTGTRVVSANASGELTADAGGIFNFLDSPINVYRPGNYYQSTGWYNQGSWVSGGKLVPNSSFSNTLDKWIDYPGDATNLANAKNLIVETHLYLNDRGARHSNIWVKARPTSTYANQKGIWLGSQESDNSKDRGFSANQTIIPCTTNGAFQFCANVSGGFPSGSVQGKSGFGVNNQSANTSWPIGFSGGVWVRIIGYTV